METDTQTETETQAPSVFGVLMMLAAAIVAVVAYFADFGSEWVVKAQSAAIIAGPLLIAGAIFVKARN